MLKLNKLYIREFKKTEVKNMDNILQRTKVITYEKLH